MIKLSPILTTLCLAALSSTSLAVNSLEIQDVTVHNPTELNFAYGKFLGTNSEGNIAAGFFDSKAILWQYTNNQWEQLAQTPDSSGITAITPSARWAAGTVNNKATLWDTNLLFSSPITLSTHNSYATAINHTGDIIGGRTNSRATIWTMHGATPTEHDLGFDGRIDALSSDGLLAVGEAFVGTVSSAVLFTTTDRWATSTLTRLPSLMNNPDEGAGTAVAISKNNQFIGGYTRHQNTGDYHGVIWSVQDGFKPTTVGHIYDSDGNSLFDNNGYSIVRAFNKDGSIAAGDYRDANTFDPRPVIWYGEKWQKARDLGTLRSDNGGSGEVFALSDDGLTAFGMADSDSGGGRPTIWNITLASTPAIDIHHTLASMSAASVLTANLLSAHHQRLTRWQQGCHALYQTYCYDLQTELYGTHHQQREADIKLKLAYGFTPSFSLGFSVNQPYYRSHFLNEQKSTGFGLFAHWKFASKEGSSWYLAPSFAMNHAQATINRPLLSGTEKGVGKANIHGVAYTLTLGQHIQSHSGWDWGWYSALRYKQLNRGAYQETGIAFPAKYDKSTFKEYALALGASVSLPLSEKMKLALTVEAEQRISGKNPLYAAHIRHIGIRMFSSTSAHQ